MSNGLKSTAELSRLLDSGRHLVTYQNVIPKIVGVAGKYGVPMGIGRNTDARAVWNLETFEIAKSVSKGHRNSE